MLRQEGQIAGSEDSGVLVTGDENETFSSASTSNEDVDHQKTTNNTNPPARN